MSESNADGSSRTGRKRKHDHEEGSHEAPWTKSQKVEYKDPMKILWKLFQNSARYDDVFGPHKTLCAEAVLQQVILKNNMRSFRKDQTETLKK